MQICILSPIYPVFSNPHLGVFVHEQAKFLVKNGHNVYVITLGDSEDKKQEIKEGIKVYRIKIKSFFILKRLLFSLSMLKNLISLNKKYNFGIIHSHFVGPLTALIGLTSKLIKRPFVITAHGIGLLNDSRFKKILTKFYLSFPLKIICVSNYVAQLAAKYTKKNKIVVINNGIDPEKLKPTRNVSDFKKKLNLKNEKILLSVGNLVERKGIGVIIKSLPEIVKIYPDIKYFIIGDGPEKKNLQKIVHELALEKYVVFIDYVSDQDLANFYNICDIFVLMSKTIKEKEGIEGFGIVYIEASYFGKPVIGGKSGGTADSIIDGVTGYRIDPTDIKEFVNKVVLLLKNDKLRKKLGQQGMKRVKTQLLWKHNVNKLIKVYKSIISLKQQNSTYVSYVKNRKVYS